jgi:uncharacterized membrane protein YebE (DUF533 family)
MSNVLGTGLTGVAGLGLLGVAIAAFDHYTQKKTPAPTPSSQGSEFHATPPPPPPGVPEPSVVAGPDPAPEVGKQQALLLIRAMIAAANADGVIDPTERKAILGRLAEAGVGEEDRTFVMKELGAPSSVEDLLATVDSPELARHVYAVSLLAIEVDTDAERDYLHYLRLRLGLDDRIVAELHRQLGIDEHL